jgi:hypothetical protein
MPSGSRVKPTLLFSFLCVSVLVPLSSIADNTCNATVSVDAVAGDSVTFKIDVRDCSNSRGSYDFLVHYLEPSTGQTAEKVWSRGWSHNGAGAFTVTEYPAKSSDEIVHDASVQSVTDCTCLS